MAKCKSLINTNGRRICIYNLSSMVLPILTGFHRFSQTYFYFLLGKTHIDFASNVPPLQTDLNRLIDSATYVYFYQKFFIRITLQYIPVKHDCVQYCTRVPFWEHDCVQIFTQCYYLLIFIFFSPIYFILTHIKRTYSI